MNFFQIAEQYFNSADFHKLDKYTSQKTYKSTILHLYELFGHIRLISTCGDKYLVDNGMNLCVAQANDVAEIYKAISRIKGESAKIAARRIFLVVWNWAERNGLVPTGSMKNLPSFRKSDKDKGVLTQAEVTVDKRMPDWMKPYAQMAKFCFYTGMRPSEAQALTWNDIHGNFIQVKHAKGRNKDQVARLCKITEQVASSLPGYGYAYHKSNLIFCSIEGKPLNKDMRSRASQYLYGKEFYSTRRGTATAMHNMGYDILTISHQLGHRDIKTTQIYIRPTMQDKANGFRGV